MTALQPAPSSDTASSEYARAQSSLLSESAAHDHLVWIELAPAAHAGVLPRLRMRKLSS